MSFDRWDAAHRVTIDQHVAEIDQKRLVFKARARKNKPALATYDGRGNPWSAAVVMFSDVQGVYMGASGQERVVAVRSKPKPKAKSKPKPKAKAKKAASPKSKAKAVPDTREAAVALATIYDAGFAYPEWTYTAAQFQRLDFAATETYYPKGASLPMVKALVTEREPVNIGMRRSYDQDELMATFGWRVGMYAKLYEQNKHALPPNVAIYVRTPVKTGTKTVLAHVINVVGFAFDDKSQPDYQFFHRGGSKALRTSELLAHYIAMWRYVFVCAKRHGLTTIQVVNVGSAAFRPGEMDMAQFSARITAPALNAAGQAFPGIATVHSNAFRFPASLATKTQAELGTILYVNAWDPFSMLGNGNNHDNSLDGFVGRSSAVAVLGWPKTNPHMRYVPVTAFK
jgi:hypothetical protein